MTSTRDDLRASRASAASVLAPGDAGYDEARAVFNGDDRPPPRADRRLREHRRRGGGGEPTPATRASPISVYGGGHGVTGAAVIDGGLCIDMRGMKGISVDPEARTVRAEAGLNWGEFDAATQEHGLAVTGGRVPDTGIAGLALGSGSGWLERKLGFTCDNLIAAEVVTADGRVVHGVGRPRTPTCSGASAVAAATSASSPRSHFQLHPVGPMVFGGMLAWPAPMAGEVVRFWRDFMLVAPDEVGSALAFITAPPADVRARTGARPPGRRRASCATRATPPRARR